MEGEAFSRAAAAGLKGSRSTNVRNALELSLDTRDQEIKRCVFKIRRRARLSAEPLSRV
jgi:hypothetical protein